MDDSTKEQVKAILDAVPEHIIGVPPSDVVAEEGVKPTPEVIEKVPGLREYKKMMRQFFTVQHKRVAACGHKFTGQEPRTNCQFCWFAYFNENGEFTKSLDELWRSPNGKNMLPALRGAKFTKMFLRFMSTVASWKAADEKGSNGGNQGKPVQEPTRIGEDPQREAEDNNIASPIGG